MASGTVKGAKFLFGKVKQIVSFRLTSMYISISFLFYTLIALWTRHLISICRNKRWNNSEVKRKKKRKEKKIQGITSRIFAICSSVQFSRSVVSDSVTPWIAACQASLSITNSRSSPRLTSIESVMPSSHLILCCPLLLLPPIPPSIRVFSNESTLRMRWPKYWSFSFSIIPSKEIPELISFRMDWLESKGLSRVLSNTTVQKHQFFSTQLSSQSNSHIHTRPLEKP